MKMILLFIGLKRRNYKNYLFFHKKLRIPRGLVWSTYFIKYHQSIVKYSNIIIADFEKGP